MKSLFKILFAATLLVLCLFNSARAETATLESVDRVNEAGAVAPTPTVQGGIKMLADAISAKNTNWVFEAHGLYAPGLTKHTGGGVGAFYAVSDVLVTGLRLDYVDGGFVMPSGSAGLQLPITPISAWPWLHITPFTYLAIGIPLSGATYGSVTIPGSYHNNNGDPTAITGVGAALRIYAPKSGKWKLDLVGDREKWSGFNGYQYRIGLLGQVNF